MLVREIFETQQEITTLTVIWARQLLSPQPKLGPVPRSLVYSSVLCRNPRERLALNKSFDDLPVLASARHSRADLNKYTKRRLEFPRSFKILLTAQDKRVAKGSARKAPASQTRYH